MATGRDVPVAHIAHHCGPGALGDPRRFAELQGPLGLVAFDPVVHGLAVRANGVGPTTAVRQVAGHIGEELAYGDVELANLFDRGRRGWQDRRHRISYRQRVGH